MQTEFEVIGSFVELAPGSFAAELRVEGRTNIGVTIPVPEVPESLGAQVNVLSQKIRAVYGPDVAIGWSGMGASPGEHLFIVVSKTPPTWGSTQTQPVEFRIEL